MGVKRHCLGAALLLLVTGLTWVQTPGARAQATGLPPASACLPADPPPGWFLQAEGKQPIWAVLETLNGKAGFGIARGEADRKTYRFRFLPYASLWRFGEPGAAAEDFPAGERVLLTLAGRNDQAPHPASSYLLEMRDEISQQVQSGQCYRIVGQDTLNYTLTAERIQVEKREALPDRLTLEYGRDTRLVLNENPVYVFKVAPGTKVWVNSGYRGNAPRMAREVLDAATLARFQRQQTLRMIARANVEGAPAYVKDVTGTSGKLQLFPDFAGWPQQLNPMAKVRIVPVEAPRDAAGALVQVQKASTGSGGNLLDLRGPLAPLKPGQVVRVIPAGRTVNYRRDVKPFLEANCLSCHKDGRALSGFSVETRERLLAGGNRGPALVPGNSGESLFYLTMTGDRNPRMPPDREPTREQLALLRAWIDAGARVE